MNPIREKEINNILSEFVNMSDKNRKLLLSMLDIYNQGYKEGYLDSKNGRKPKIYIKRMKK